MCAAPLPSGDVCGSCLARRPHFDGASIPYLYAFPVDRLIRAYKYGGELRLAFLFGAALADEVVERVDLIVPIPLTPERLRTRGFNQALEIARHVGKRHRTPVAAAACRRPGDAIPQALLPWRERERNVRGAFVCDADVTGLRVAVVDDVLTTGATLNALAKSLKRAGAKEVLAWVVARACGRDDARRTDPFPVGY